MTWIHRMWNRFHKSMRRNPHGDNKLIREQQHFATIAEKVAECNRESLEAARAQLARIYDKERNLMSKGH